MLLRPGRIGRRLALCTIVALLACGAAAASASALPYFQVNFPRGQPKGIVLLIHGGGWVYVGPTQVHTLDPQVEQFVGDGWITVNTDYAPLAGSLPDVRAVYDAIRQRFAPPLPICAYGQSAGANLALLLAESRPVSCVIDAAGPTDLAKLRGMAADYFIDQLEEAGVTRAEYSPALQAGQRLTVPTLAEYAKYDWLVPLSQGQELQVNDPAHVTLFTLDPGSTMFVHSSVDPSELGLVHARENQLLAAVAAGAVAPAAAPATAAGPSACPAKKKTRHHSRTKAKHRRSSHPKRHSRPVARKTAC